MKNIVLFSLLIFISVIVYPASVTISNSGTSFSPSTVTINLGDTVIFTLGSAHNAQEVSEDTWNANGSTSNGGFQLPFGGGQFVPTHTGTYYYVCVPHASIGMKGIIIVNSTSTAVISKDSHKDFLVYPNPAVAFINVKLNVNTLSHVDIDIYDMTGRMVAKLLSQNLSSGLFQQQFDLDRSKLKAGKYFIKTSIGLSSQLESIILE